MRNPDFVYVTYIKSTPEKVWVALTKPEFTRQYWACDMLSDWKKGSPWRMSAANAASKICGEVLESNPPKHLSYSWRDPNDAALGTSRVSFELESEGDVVRLTIVHDQLTPAMASKISNGWPRVLAGLKSFLETGQVIDIWNGKTQGCNAA